ncbi:MAG: hypothetical protein JO356_07205 [Acidobacteria bacterium]|nr:hypothetical protein [Acidobacteriota bacterium]
MPSKRPKFRIRMLIGCLAVLSACNQQLPPDRPRLTAGVIMRDVVFRSASLHRDMPYRVVLPSTRVNQKMPVVYLLHGGGGNFHDWTNYSDVARFAEWGLILVMPEGDDSYYTNSAEKPQNRWEDYIIRDLVDDVERRFSMADSSQRAVVGVSMGGFGAIKITLRHPQLFSFAAGLSPALDVPSRPFSLKRMRQWRFHRSIFGAWGGIIQNENDPFILARSANPEHIPFLFLTCGEQEGLFDANRRFARLLGKRTFRYEFQSGPGGHDWNQWNTRLSMVFDRLSDHLPIKK